MITGKRILLLGDDDLVSIVIAFLNPSYEEILILDVDTKLLDKINKIVKDHNLPRIRAHAYDVREVPLPQYINKFDVVLTDPPYTKAGISLFINRSVEYLRKPLKDNFSGQYIFLCAGSSFKMPERFLKVQEVIQKYNLVIEDVVSKFNRYFGAESLGSASSIYILKTTALTDPVDEYLENRIYTYEKTKDEKFPYVEHYTFKLYEVPSKLLNSKKALLKAAGLFCRRHKLKVVGTEVTKFSPKGQTITFILANSNFLIHTWPEHNALHIDLITCAPIYKSIELIQNVTNLFEAQYIESKKVE